MPQIGNTALDLKGRKCKGTSLAPSTSAFPTLSTHAHLMCLTQFEPILSATNSTVLRREGGWLWKKAWASCACGEEGTVREEFPFSSPPGAPCLYPAPYLQPLGGPGGLGSKASGGGGGSDLPHKAPTPATAA